MLSMTFKEYPHYEVFEDGSVWRLAHHSPKGMFLKRKKLKQCKMSNDYLMVSIYDKDGNKKRVYVHRLVYMAFYGDIPSGMEIDHIDANRGNNTISNLRLCSHQDNCNNSKSLERYKIANSKEKGKIHREKMQEARSAKKEEKLKRLYLFILNEKGAVRICEFIRRGHCNYYRARRIIDEMRNSSEIREHP